MPNLNDIDPKTGKELRDLNAMELIAYETDRDREEQYEVMDYTISCDICGKEVATIRSDDFNRPRLMRGVESFQNKLNAHNEEHYIKPIFYGE